MASIVIHTPAGHALVFIACFVWVGAFTYTVGCVWVCGGYRITLPTNKSQTFQNFPFQLFIHIFFTVFW